MNNVVLIGRLCGDPVLRYLPNGTATTSFTLAVDRGLSKEKKQEAEAKNYPTADFIRIVVWGKSAENCANYLVKGRLVEVQGSIQTGSYTKDDGSKVYTTDIRANSVEFLEFGDKQDNQQQNYVPEGFQPVDNIDIPF